MGPGMMMENVVRRRSKKRGSQKKCWWQAVLILCFYLDSCFRLLAFEDNHASHPIKKTQQKLCA